MRSALQVDAALEAAANFRRNVPLPTIFELGRHKPYEPLFSQSQLWIPPESGYILLTFPMYHCLDAP